MTLDQPQTFDEAFAAEYQDLNIASLYDYG